MAKKSKYDPATYHQRKVAKGSLKMNSAMLGVMGGPSKKQARKILKNTKK